MKGKLYGIGVGPGDPELLTLKAKRLIEECDIVAVPVKKEGEDSVALNRVPVGSQSQFQLQIAPIKITAPMSTEAMYQCSCKNAVICSLFI